MIILAGNGDEMKTPDVQSILYDYLKANGFDGLCGECCGCGLDSLMVCDYPRPDCEPAYKIKCRRCGEEWFTSDEDQEICGNCMEEE